MGTVLIADKGRRVGEKNTCTEAEVRKREGARLNERYWLNALEQKVTLS